MEIDIGFVLLFLAIGFVAGMILIGIVLSGILINQETADDICKQLTNNQTARAEGTQDKKLICVLPSFDETQNIIIKTNSEE